MRNKTFHVWFVDTKLYNHADLREDLISNEINLYLSNDLFMNEIDGLIDKAYEILKKRFKTVTYEIHWENFKKEEEEIL